MGQSVEIFSRSLLHGYASHIKEIVDHTGTGGRFIIKSKCLTPLIVKISNMEAVNIAIRCSVVGIKLHSQDNRMPGSLSEYLIEVSS